jgi:hypothetical protein
MKFIKFDYTDLKNKTTRREAVVVQEPTDKVSCIDLSELDSQAQAEFITQYDAIRNTFLEQVKSLQKTFEVQHRYRQFFPHRMCDIVEEEV